MNRTTFVALRGPTVERIWTLRHVDTTELVSLPKPIRHAISRFSGPFSQRCNKVASPAGEVDPSGPKQILTSGVSDGTRTRDIQDHNLVLYQLNYTHHDRRTDDRRRTRY
jgi:hypothetical protein